MKLRDRPARMSIPTVLLAGLNTFCASAFQLLVIYRLGVGALSDLYYGVAIVTVVIFTMFLDPLSNVLIPMFVEKRNAEQETAEFFWNSVLIVLGGGAVILFAIYFPIRATFPMLFKSLRWAQPTEVGRIVVAYSTYQILFGALTVKNCYLFAFGRPAAAQSNTLVGWLVSLLLLSTLNIATDVSRIAYCLAAGNAAALLFPTLDRKILAFRGSDFRIHLGTLLKRGGLLTSGSAVFRVESLVDGAAASFSGVGSLTVYQLFSRTLLSVATIINSGYVQPITKHLAEDAAGERWKLLKRQTGASALWASVAGLTCVAPLLPVLIFLHYRPIRALEVYVQIFEGHYAVLLLLLGYLVGSLVWKVYAAGLIVLRREHQFAVVCVTTFLVGVTFKLLGAYAMGLPGLALGTSLYWMLGATCMAAAFWASVGQRQNLSWETRRRVSTENLHEVGSAD